TCIRVCSTSTGAAAGPSPAAGDGTGGASSPLLASEEGASGGGLHGVPVTRPSVGGTGCGTEGAAGAGGATVGGAWACPGAAASCPVDRSARERPSLA